MRGHGCQWFSHKMNNRHPLQLKKSKSWEPFGSYQLNCTANLAHLPQNRPNFEVNGLDWPVVQKQTIHQQKALDLSFNLGP